MTTKHVVEEISADEIIQEHREQEVIQACIDAESTDADIELVIACVEQGMTIAQIKAFMQNTEGVN